MTWLDAHLQFQKRKAADMAAGGDGFAETWSWFWGPQVPAFEAKLNLLTHAPDELIDDLLGIIWPSALALFGQGVGVVAALTYGGIGDLDRMGLAVLATHGWREVEWQDPAAAPYPLASVPVLLGLGNREVWRRMLCHKLFAGPVVGQDGALWPFDTSGR